MLCVHIRVHMSRLPVHVCDSAHPPTHIHVFVAVRARLLFFTASDLSSMLPPARCAPVPLPRSRRPRHRQIESMLRTHCVRCASIIAYADVCARCRTPCHELALSCPGRVIVGREWYAYGLLYRPRRPPPLKLGSCERRRRLCRWPQDAIKMFQASSIFTELVNHNAYTQQL